ncbi:MAG TPA: transketolase C-terminal domain-containing protein [Ktedonobacterales bacterium]|nr:transketolase C-terminal domain-containing protein [Ktedonobacterales bacterium]
MTIEQLAMRQQMVRTLTDILDEDKRVAVLLGGISVSLFDKSLYRAQPERIYDVGISEQAMVSMAAGLALEGMIPVVHTIAPFLAERAFEQIKDDFVYQQIGGNFVTIGASYDYSAEGMTHQGSGDVQVLRSLPGMRIVVPGAADEFDTLFRAHYADGQPTYYRLSERQNSMPQRVRFGRAEVIREGSEKSRATIVAVGPMLSATLAATEGLDVTVLYYTTVVPFDGETLRSRRPHGHVILVEPFYAGTLIPEVTAAMGDIPVRVEAIGVPPRLITRYGTPEQHDHDLGLDVAGIRARVARFLET